MFSNNRITRTDRYASPGLEANPPRLPLHRMRERPIRNIESEHVAGNVKRLDPY